MSAAAFRRRRTQPVLFEGPAQAQQSLLAGLNENLPDELNSALLGADEFCSSNRSVDISTN